MPAELTPRPTSPTASFIDQLSRMLPTATSATEVANSIYRIKTGKSSAVTTVYRGGISRKSAKEFDKLLRHIEQSTQTPTDLDVSRVLLLRAANACEAAWMECRYSIA